MHKLTYPAAVTTAGASAGNKIAGKVNYHTLLPLVTSQKTKINNEL